MWGRFLQAVFFSPDRKTGVFFQQLESQDIYFADKMKAFCGHMNYTCIFYNHWYMHDKLQFHQFSIISILRSFIKIQLTRDNVWKGFIPCVK